MVEIINIESNLEMIREALDSLNQKLDFNSTKLKLADNHGNVNIMEFIDLKKQLDKLYDARQYELTAKNCLHILGHIPGRLEMIKENLTDRFEELIKIIDILQESNKEYHDELELKESELSEANSRIKELIEERTNDRFENLQTQITNLTTLLVNGKSIQKPEQEKDSPSKYFQELPTPVSSDIIEPETPTTNPDRQKAHSDVLEMMKGEGLYPLHKSDFIEAKEKYLALWEFTHASYPSLKYEDYPRSIDRLDEYKDYDDDYLDVVRD
jgi:DNA repair exonuclease SbcCD ATPase subunit